jgi:hypothetical protein
MTIRLRSPWLMASGLILGFASCTPSTERMSSCADGNCVRHAEDSFTADLISANRCQLQNNRLVNCSIPAQTLNFTQFETAVPLRTTVVSLIRGTCPVNYPLQVGLSADGAAAQNFAYYRGGQTVVRRPDGAPILNLAITDSSAWTTHAVFDPSCQMSLSLTPNEIDVSSKAEAQAILDNLQADLSAKANTAQRYQELMLYAKAFNFLKAVSESFLGQLSDDSLQAMRASAQEAQPALEQVITDCNSLTPDQKRNLFKLAMALGKLDHPEDWLNADGSRKTLRDFLGADDQKVIDTISQLAASAASGDGGVVDYDALYHQAALDVVNAQKKIDLAKHQLASFLN